MFCHAKACRPILALAFAAVQFCTADSFAQTAAEQIQAVYESSQSAKTLAEYDTLLSKCEAIRKLDLKPVQDDYLKKLMAWGQDRRGELHAERAAQLARDGQQEAAATADAAALADFEAAIRNDPTRWKAVHNRGVSYAISGRYEDAIKDFTRVIELQPSHSNAWFNRAEIRYELGKYEDAIRDYDRAVALKPDDAGAFTSRGHARFALGQHDLGLRDYDQAVRLNRSAETLINRADAYRSLARWQPAATDYRDAVQIAGDNGRAYQSAAWFMATCPDERFRNADLAVRAAERAVELEGKSDFHYLDTLAAAYANAGRWDDAVKAAEEAAEAAPESDRANVNARLRLYQARQPYRQGMKPEVASK